MKRSYWALFLLAAMLVVGAVSWRVLSRPTSEQSPGDGDLAKAGEVLFKHEWQPNDPLSPGGDGLGPVFNARSCVECHHQNGVGGSGGQEHNVTTFVVFHHGRRKGQSDGVIHTFATEQQHQETLAHIDPQSPPLWGPSLGRAAMGRGGKVFFTKVSSVIAGPGPGSRFKPTPLPVFLTDFVLSQRKTPALFGAGSIDSIPDHVIIANEQNQRLRYAKFSVADEVLPLGRAHRLPGGKIGRFGWKAQTARLAQFVQAACANELGLGNPTNPQPKSLAKPDYQAAGLDLTQLQCDQLTAFVAALPRPVQRSPHAAGKALFVKIGCAECHTPNLGAIEGLYSDLLLHRMGEGLTGAGISYGGLPRPPIDIADAPALRPDEWRTPPLWGVADAAPYLHDGRAATLQDAILMHGGQAASSVANFESLPQEEQVAVILFLRTLRAP
jgi:CxxC motif-containing protein (DUF1111 family)